MEVILHRPFLSQVTWVKNRSISLHVVSKIIYRLLINNIKYVQCIITKEISQNHWKAGWKITQKYKLEMQNLCIRFLFLIWSDTCPVKLVKVLIRRFATCYPASWVGSSRNFHTRHMLKARWLAQCSQQPRCDHRNTTSLSLTWLMHTWIRLLPFFNK